MALWICDIDYSVALYSRVYEAVHSVVVTSESRSVAHRSRRRREEFGAVSGSVERPIGHIGSRWAFKWRMRRVVLFERALKQINGTLGRFLDMSELRLAELLDAHPAHMQRVCVGQWTLTYQCHKLLELLFGLFHRTWSSYTTQQHGIRRQQLTSNLAFVDYKDIKWSTFVDCWSKSVH